MPSRKAAPLPQPASLEGSQGSPAKTELHSPLSPLSPGSPIFPDGLFTPMWFVKHQHQVPCLILAFFHLSADDAGEDDAVRRDINAIRTSLGRSGFRTRLAAVLLSDQSILESSGLEDRLASIRRSTSLDSKTGLFFMPPMASQGEIATFIRSMMTALQPLYIEYYRELTKHSRRKKARGGPAASSVAHTAAGSQSVSTQGWLVRYEIKLGAFAEMRQEMEIAERHYSAAIDGLHSSEGIFEVTASWAPKWTDARLICDALTVRILRCQLWSASTTEAARFWMAYKARVQSLLDRRGKGSETYGWSAWESRWAVIMAQLIQRADLPLEQPASKLRVADADGAQQDFFALPEHTFATADRLLPSHYLHHSGYWLRHAAMAYRTRRKRAMAIPQEDRTAPAESKASLVANRVRIYDYYLVPEVHNEAAFDHLAEIVKLSDAAAQAFAKKGQARLAQSIKLELAKDCAGSNEPRRTADLLLPVWKQSKWRDDGWHSKLAELLVVLYRCAQQLDEKDIALATLYELHAVCDRPPDDVQLDLGCLSHPVASQTTLLYRDGEVVSPVGVQFAFGSGETHVGDVLECQLSVVSVASRRSSPLIFDVAVTLEPYGLVEIGHDADASSLDDTLTHVDLRLDGEEELQGAANLSLRPGERRTIGFNLAMRQAGLLRMTDVSLSFRAGDRSIRHTFTDSSAIRSESALFATTAGTMQKTLSQTNSLEVSVLPKPPKVVIRVGLQKTYYTDELLRLPVAIVNEEIEAVEGSVRADVRGEAPHGMAVRLQDAEDAREPTADLTGDDSSSRLLSRLASHQTDESMLCIKAPPHPTTASIQIDVKYWISSDANAPLRKTHDLQMTFVAPFKANFTFAPLLYPGPWPSYFTCEGSGSSDQIDGIPQLWRLSSLVKSLAAEPLKLHSIEAVVSHTTGDAAAWFRDREPFTPQTLRPAHTATATTFELHTQKHALEDRRPCSVDSDVHITWSRDGGHSHRVVTTTTTTTRTTMEVPRLHPPVSEPRVLCTRDADTDADVDAVLSYHVENPSMHFLTFVATMGASDDFAFQGPKARAFSLAPASRYRVQYRVLLHRHHHQRHDNDGKTARSAKSEGRWIWPALEVVDSFYQKSLRVYAAGEGVKMDEQDGGPGVWVG